MGWKMNDRSFEEYLKAANAPLDEPGKNLTVGPGEPQFELYHFALSVCSQKVRACLAECQATYIAHDINIQPGNYHLDYIRLRLLARAGKSFADQYTGRSAMDTEGFDPAVVPTLVDLEQRQVHVDSAHICEHIVQATSAGAELVPESLRAVIDAEIDIVDGTPHVAILYGAHPDGDFRPEKIRQVMPGIHDRKITKLVDAREQATGDTALVAALDAKIRKETAGKSFVATPEMMRNAVGEIVGIVAALNTRLSDGRQWVCGDRFTLADIHWSVSLFRLKWIGMGFSWQGGHPLNDAALPVVDGYAKRLFARKSFSDAVIHWPGVPRSEYVADYYSD